jgi:hypothetical protein
MLNIFIIILLIIAIITIVCLSIAFLIDNKNNIPEISPPVEEESDTLSIEDEPPQKEKSILDSINSYEDHMRSMVWGSNNKVCGSSSYATGWHIPENNHSKYIVRVNNKALLDDSSIYDTSPKEGDLALDFSTNTTYMFNGIEWSDLIEDTDNIDDFLLNLESEIK